MKFKYDIEIKKGVPYSQLPDYSIDNLVYFDNVAMEYYYYDGNAKRYAQVLENKIDHFVKNNAAYNITIKRDKEIFAFRKVHAVYLDGIPLVWTDYKSIAKKYAKKVINKIDMFRKSSHRMIQ